LETIVLKPVRGLGPFSISTPTNTPLNKPIITFLV
jgi:hypothetical protein